MDQFLGRLNGIGAQLNPLAKNLERGFGQVRQYASEKLGTAEDITELPEEYLVLERKVDAVRGLLAALHKAYGQEWFVPAAVTETVTDLAKTVRVGVSTAIPALGGTGGGTGSQAGSPTQAQSPTEPVKQTTAHSVGKACTLAGGALGDEPLGAGVKKFAATQEKMGDAELVMSTEKEAKFVKPVGELLYERIGSVMRARRTVTNSRLSLDSIKSRFKSATPQRAEALQVELEKAEDVFVEAVEEAIKLMKGVVESPEILKHLSDLVGILLAYHKQCAQILGDLAPEIDEMHVTQEALYSTAKLG